MTSTSGCFFEVRARALRAVHPDGVNINDQCGATSTAQLQAAVTRADAGVAFDGDADRLMAVDEDDVLVDGDQILGICALDHHRRGVLPGSAVHECPVG